MLNYLVLSGGIICGQLITLGVRHSLVLLLTCLALLIISIWAGYRHSIIKIINLILIALVAIGYSNLRLEIRKNNLINQPITQLTVNGYLKSPVTATALDNQAIIAITDGELQSQNILLNYPESYIIDAGENYLFTVNLRPLNTSNNPDAFDYQQYLITQNIIANAKLVAPPLKLQPNYGFYSQVTKVRVYLVNYLSQVLQQQKYAGFFIALVTGYQGLIPSEQWDTFRKTGITHIVSISGLHVTLATSIFIYLINLLLNQLPPRKTPRQIMVAWSAVFFATLYSFLAGFSIPTQRSLYMIIIAAYLLTSRRYIPLTYQLAISLALVLLIDPFAIYSIGFWFSYLLIAAIFITIATQRPNTSKLATWLRLQIIITICGIPLSLYYFSSASLISPIANLWAIPVIGNLFTPAVLIASASHIAWLIIFVGKLLDLALIPIEYLAHIPLYWQVKPNLASVLLCYLGLILFTLPLPWRGKNIVALLLILNIVFSTRVNHELIATRAQIHAFSNPNAGFALITTKNTHLLVLNHNTPDDSSKAFINSVLPYLNAQRITKLDYVLSNQDESALLTTITQQGIHIIATTIESSSYVDGVEISLMRQESSFALLLKTHDELNYIGNCLAPRNNEAINNVFILMPQRKCSWMLTGTYNNLIINYNYQQQREIDSLTNNLHLNSKNLYLLLNGSAVNIFSK